MENSVVLTSPIPSPQNNSIDSAGIRFHTHAGWALLITAKYV